jgi:hypothetical protein
MFEWKIGKITPSFDDVFNVAWTLVGTREHDGKSFVADTTGSVDITYDTSFSPFENLSEDQQLQYIFQNGVDGYSAEEIVSKKLFNLISPPIIVPPLPTA